MANAAIAQADSLDAPRQVPAPETVAGAPRLSTCLRGLVMVLMPLDHTREFFTNYAGNPLDPQHTTFLLYLTRWITHLCAPVFVFLAGTSIFLQQQRKIRSHLTQHLLARGLWLIIVELTLVHLVFNFHWQWNVQILEVIWAIGASMMVMALLIHLECAGVLLIGACLVAGHNLLDGLTVIKVRPSRLALATAARPGSHLRSVHDPAYHPGRIPPVALGGSDGPRLRLRQSYSFNRGRNGGSGESVQASPCWCFRLLRWSNLYGDPVRWSSQPTWWRTGHVFYERSKVSALAFVSSGYVGHNRADCRRHRVCRTTRCVGPAEKCAAGLWPGAFLLFSAAYRSHSFIGPRSLCCPGWKLAAGGLRNSRAGGVSDRSSTRLWLRTGDSVVYLDLRGSPLLSRLQVVCGGEEAKPESTALIPVRAVAQYTVQGDDF